MTDGGGPPEPSGSEPESAPEDGVQEPARSAGGRARDPRVRAGLELTGRTLRYAEVDLGPRADPYASRRLSLGAPAPVPGARLLRLGACDFEFDVAEALLDPSGPTHLNTIATAVRDIFKGARASRVHVAVHPWHATSFFAPLPEGLPAAEKFEQLRQEAAMLADARVARPVRVKATPVRVEQLHDGSRVHWHHVLRLPESVHARASYITERLGDDVEPAFVDAPGAVAALAARLRSPEEQAATVERPEGTPFTLALGGYGQRLEAALSRGGTWHFSHWAEAEAQADGAYFVAALLERLGIPRDRVRRLYVYGEAAGHPPTAGVEELLGMEALPLNPLSLFGLARSSADPLVLAGFAPCVGAAMTE